MRAALPCLRGAARDAVAKRVEGGAEVVVRFAPFDYRCELLSLLARETGGGGGGARDEPASPRDGDAKVGPPGGGFELGANAVYDDYFSADGGAQGENATGGACAARPGL